MGQRSVASVLDYSVEGKDTEDPLDYALSVTLKYSRFCKGEGCHPFAVFKPTGYGRFILFEKMGRGEPFTPLKRTNGTGWLNDLKQHVKKHMI